MKDDYICCWVDVTTNKHYESEPMPAEDAEAKRDYINKGTNGFLYAWIRKYVENDISDE